MSLLGMLYLAAAVLCALLGVAHSYLGERLILMRLFQRTELPKLWGETEMFKRQLRFAWHVTSIAWVGCGAVFLHMAQGPVASPAIAAILAAVFLLTGAIILFASRGRHFAWPLFVVIGLIALYGALA